MEALEYANHQNTLALQEELDWVEAAKQDPARFRFIYDKYYHIIFQFVYRRTHDEELAADLTSQTFLKAMMNLEKFRFRGVPFSAWLYRIATNEVNGYFRKNKSSPVFSLEDKKVRLLIEESGEQPDEDKLRRLAFCLEQFSTDEIFLLQLRFYEEKSFKEIAFILDISEGNAKMRTYRILEKLRGQMIRGAKLNNNT